MSSQVIPVRVAVRARPLIPREESEGCQTCLWFHSQEPQVVLGKDKAFTFDYVFSPSHTQLDVYEKAAQNLVSSTFKGYNATVLAYGQTGSGKTYSMGGCYEASLSQDEMAMGIIPRILRDLFRGIADRPEYNFQVCVSYLEIYNEELLDLLCSPSQRQTLSIREEMNGEIKIKGLTEVAVSCFEETLQCLSQGAQSRTVGATAMNDTSSRSHAIFTVHVQKTKKDDANDHCVAKFHLVDLAGSERAKKTRAEGDRFKEGVNINRGLLALGNVISALGEDVQKRGHIPYRDSKLTRLLQDSLGGNSHTLMVACVSPADSNMEETLNTLRYADRARKIKNKAVVNRDPQSQEIMRLRQVVQSLQMQLIQRGGEAGDIVCESSEVTSVSAGTQQEMSRLTARTEMLEKENSELTKELERALDQNTRMCQNAIEQEAAYEKLKAKLQLLKQDTGVNFDLLDSSLGVDNEEVKQELEKVKKLVCSVQDGSDDVDVTANSFAPEGGDKDEETGENQEDLPESPDSRARSTEHVLRQAKMSRELQELNQMLAKKQELAAQMSHSQEGMDSLRSHYEAMMKEWEDKVKQLQKEKEDLNATLCDVRSNVNTQRISEQRRKRLQELEGEMASLKRKMAEQTRVVKLKDQSDKQVSRLNTEIVGLKQQRVRLMKQMKEESDQWRKWKQQKDKEVMQLMEKDRKRRAEVAKLQQTNEKQQNVLKRKVEEAAAANKRLKEALARQKAVVSERSSKVDSADTTSIGNRIRKWLSRELDVRISLREARYHMTSLMADRKELSQQKRDLEERLGEASFAKKSVQDHQGGCSESSPEEEEMRKQMDVLSTEIELRNVQIQDLQQKICDADQDSKGQSMWEGIHTMLEAKCALRWLLEQAVDGKADRSALQEELNAAKEGSKERQAVEERLGEEMRRLKQHYEEELLQLRKEHQHKTLFLLGMEKGGQQSKQQFGDAELRKKLEIQSAELREMSTLAEELERKTEECQELKRTMTGIMVSEGKVALMPSIDDPNGSPFTTPRPKLQHNTRADGKMPPVSHTPVTPGGFNVETDEEWDEEDDTMDPDGKMAPLVGKRAGKTMTSSSAMNSTFSVDSDDNEAGASAQQSCVLRPIHNKSSRTSKTRVTNILKLDETIRSSDEFEKPAIPAEKLSKRGGGVAFLESEEFKNENSKRRRTILSTKKVSYFDPPE